MGIAGSEMLPFKYWQKINEIEIAEIGEVDEMILKQRSIKSPQEIKVIEHAYFIAEKGIQKGIDINIIQIDNQRQFNGLLHICR